MTSFKYYLGDSFASMYFIINKLYSRVYMKVLFGSLMLRSLRSKAKIDKKGVNQSDLFICNKMLLLRGKITVQSVKNNV